MILHETSARDWAREHGITDWPVIVSIDTETGHYTVGNLD